MINRILLFLLVISSSVLAQEPDSSSALFQMREAERNFTRASVMYGRNAAFVENFADEAIIFTDKWITNGKQFWNELKARPIVLKWEPEYMDIAESRGIVKWVALDKASFEGAVLHVPSRDEIAPEISEQLIVELYSK